MGAGGFSDDLLRLLELLPLSVCDASSWGDEGEFVVIILELVVVVVVTGGTAAAGGAMAWRRAKGKKKTLSERPTSHSGTGHRAKPQATIYLYHQAVEVIRFLQDSPGVRGCAKWYYT